MRYLKNQEALRFNIGDILVKQSKQGEDWKTDKTGIGAPKKYMYVFENELGVGYIKQLKVDGSGFTSHLQCVANYDGEYTRLALDPEFVDHMLIGEDDFKYNALHAYKKSFRQEAMKKNNKLCLHVKAKKIWVEEQMKPGDKFWCGHSFQQLIDSPYEIVSVTRDQNRNGKTIDVSFVVKDQSGVRHQWNERQILYRKLSLTKPYPLEDDLCGHQK